MATLTQMYNIAFGDTVLKTLIAAAIIKLAAYILIEDAGVTNHVNRLIWAKWIQASSRGEIESHAEKFLMVAATNGDIVTQCPNYQDATVEYVVGIHVNNLAIG
jgi:hypothetical protein